MTQLEALKMLGALGVDAFTTRDAAAYLHVTPANAHMILKRLAGHQFVTHLARGKWGIGRDPRRALLAEHIAAPYPAYLSLQTALFRHGLIEQIPAVFYAVTVGRTRRVQTPSGTVSLHHVPARLFTGFEVTPEGSKVALPEKALFDALYLGPGRSRLFASLPEVTFPRTFDWSRAQGYVTFIKSPPRRVHVQAKLDLLRNAGRARQRLRAPT